MIYRDPNSSAVSIYHWNTDNVPFAVIDKITDSNGVETKVNFESLVNSNHYAKLGETSYPLSNTPPANFVVSSVAQDNGVGGTNSTSYKYEGMRIHRLGLGNLGFSKVTKTNDQTGVKSVTEYSHDYQNRLQGTEKSVSTIIPSGVVVKSKSLTFDSNKLSDGKRYVQKLRHSVHQYKSVAGNNTSKSETFNCYSDHAGCTSETNDQYGNNLYTKSVVTDQQSSGHTYSTVTRTELWDKNSFSSNSTDWNVSQPKQITVSKERSNSPKITKTTQFNSYYENGLLKKTTLEPGDQQLVEEHEYNDIYGRMTKKTVSGVDFETRVSTIIYDANDPRLVVQRDPLGHDVTQKQNAAFGSTQYVIDANGLRVDYEYDDFGRKTKESRPDGSTTTFEYKWCYDSNSCPQGAKYFVRSTVTDSIASTVSTAYFDQLERNLYTDTTGFDGQVVRVENRYDAQGRLYAVSEPYVLGETPLFTTTTEYDILNRPKTTVSPSGSQSNFAYNGFETTLTNALGQTKTTTRNALREIISIIDHDGKNLTFNYDSYGNLVKSIDEAGNEITVRYDTKGNRTHVLDPDKGNWSYYYNALSELVLQIDAMSQSTCMAYDTAGRMVKHIDYYKSTLANAKIGCIGDTTNVNTSTWAYDSAPGKGKGKIHRISGQHGYQKSLAYDELGRVSSNITTIAGDSYSIQTSYHPNSSKAHIQTYPSANAQAFRIKHLYNNYGFAYRTQNVDSGEIYWTANNVDVKGKTTDFTLGNGVNTKNTYYSDTGFIKSIDTLNSRNVTLQYLNYQFDDLGNLTYRKDFLQGTSEILDYDNINRLTGSSVAGVGIQNHNYHYDADGLGNLITSPASGTLTYGNPSANCSVSFAGPHAVTHISGGNKQAATHYCYNANGDMVSGAGRNITYTPFGKPQLITKGNASVELKYGPNRSRIQRIDNSKITTTYVDGIYEKIDDGSSIKHKYYVGDYLIVTKEAFSTQNRYLHRDHLGSVDTISDEQGYLVKKMSFDAWGVRRPTNWFGQLDIFNFKSEGIDRGYTNHEHMDSVGLIHMNGRVYDPIIGRFISADPIIQNPHDLQSYNRYAYVRNNPLTMTDPTGFSWASDTWNKVKNGVNRLADKVGDANRVYEKFTINYYAERAAIRGYMQYHGWASGRVPGVKETDDLIMRNEYTKAAFVMVATYYGGPAGAAAAQMHLAYLHGADVDQIRNTGKRAYVTAYAAQSLNGYVDSNVSNSYLSVGAKGMVGGTISAANGGSFKQGFMVSAGSQALAEIYKGMLQSGINDGLIDDPHAEGVYPDEIPYATENAGPKTESVSDFKKAQFGFKVDEMPAAGDEAWFQPVPQNVPFTHPISIHHDVWNGQIINSFGAGAFTYSNVPTMLVSATLAVGGSMRNYAYIYSITEDKEY